MKYAFTVIKTDLLTVYILKIAIILCIDCCTYKRFSSLLEANISDVIEVDCGDGVAGPRLDHAAGQAPGLGVFVELEDLVIKIPIPTT